MVATITERLSTYLRGLGRRRKTRTVTADDAHRFLERTGITDSYERLAAINSVLNNFNTQITPNGTAPSERPAAKGRQITNWQYV